MKMKMHPDLELVLQTAADCHGVLAGATIDHVIIGGLAVYLHGDKNRRPRDVDLLTRDADADRIRLSLTSAQYEWHSFRKAYVSRQGVRTEPHWNGKNGRHLPDLDAIDAVEIDNLPVIGLAALIESKLQSDITGDSKHRADVLTLLRHHRLGNAYADKLGSPVRDLFCQLVASEQS